MDGRWRVVEWAKNGYVTRCDWRKGKLMMQGEINVTKNRIWIIVFGLAVILQVMAAIRFTRFGLEMRAVVQNRRIAATMGIRTGRVDALTFAFGSGIAGMAGVALSQIDNVSPNLGTGYIAFSSTHLTLPTKIEVLISVVAATVTQKTQHTERRIMS